MDSFNSCKKFFAHQFNILSISFPPYNILTPNIQNNIKLKQPQISKDISNSPNMENKTIPPNTKRIDVDNVKFSQHAKNNLNNTIFKTTNQNIDLQNNHQATNINYNIKNINTNNNVDSETLPLDMYDYKNIVFNILKLLNINSINIICHSFGFRVALMLTTTNININKIVITGGAGIRLKPNFLKKLNMQHKSLLLKKHPILFTRFASKDYVNLNQINRQTFKNVVNKDLTNYISQLKCPILLFWGKKDKSTPIKYAKIIQHFHPNLQLKIIEDGDHFCYLKYNQLFIDCCNNFFMEEVIC